MKDSFNGKTAVVTGGSRGIGKAIVDLLVQQGCRVIYTGTKQAQETGNNPNTSCWPLDLADDSSVDEFLERIIKEPKIDILINNAGINIIEPIDELKKESWEQILKVNLTGAMLLTKEISKKMKKSGTGGKILNISSIYGVISKEQRGAYSASKAGLIGLTRASALDLAKDNILVNALCPGFTLTDLTKSILSKEEIAKMSEDVPLGRFAKESEMAHTAVFLCSDLNTYMTGQTIIVDGGVTIK